MGTCCFCMILEFWVSKWCSQRFGGQTVSLWEPTNTVTLFVCWQKRFERCYTKLEPAKGINKNAGSLNSVTQKFKQAQIRCRQCEKKPRRNSCNCNCKLGHAACASCVCACARFAYGRIFRSNEVCASSVHIVDPADVAYRAQHRRQSCQNNSHAAWTRARVINTALNFTFTVFLVPLTQHIHTDNKHIPHEMRIN